MIDDPDLNEILSINTADPQAGFDILLRDFTKRMRRSGVSENAIKGMKIALNISYRLGEKAGFQRLLQTREADEE